MTTITLLCVQCKTYFVKARKEYTRQVKNGRTHFFCTLRCSAVYLNNEPTRMEINRKIAKRNFSVSNSDPHVQAKAARAREGWKYVNLSAQLTALNKRFQFEYPLVTRNGTIRLYDLALFDRRILVEFDGDSHQRGCIRSDAIDREKNALARSNGWRLDRISVAANAVIPSSKLRRIDL